MKRIKMAIVVPMCAMGLMSLCAADPAISVTATPQYPWNGLVDIKFTITGTTGSKYDTSFAAKDVVGGTNLTMKTLTKADGTAANVAKEQLLPGTYNWVWNATADLGEGTVLERATVEVKTAEPLVGVQLWENGPYWAECNVGASKPEEYGYYFWWGDTVGYKRSGDKWVAADGSNANFSFKSENCPTYNLYDTQLQSAGYIDDSPPAASDHYYVYAPSGNLVAKYDAATVHCGAPWRMPTAGELFAVVGNCDTVWTTRNGVYGRLVKGKGAYASKSIFLPAAGIGLDSELYDSVWNSGWDGHYWSSTPNEGLNDNPICSYFLYFNSIDLQGVYESGRTFFGRWIDETRCSGCSIRPVRGAEAAATGATGLSGEFKIVIAQPLSISNVVARQRYPWNGLVELEFTIIGTTGTKYNTSFAAKDVVGGTNITMKTLTKADGTAANAAKEMLLPGTYNWVWNATADLGEGAVLESVVVEVKTVEPPDGVQLWADGPYWAECNVGATKPEESGYYFMWGDTVGYKRNGDKWVAADGSNANFSFKAESCPTYDMTADQLLSAGYIDSTDSSAYLDRAVSRLLAKHDAATVHLGVPWRMPTGAEFSAFETKCDMEWKTRNGVYGCLLKGKGSYASKSIFLPAVGMGEDSNLCLSLADDQCGTYWSSSIAYEKPDYGYPPGKSYLLYFTWRGLFMIYFDGRLAGRYGATPRFYGCPVRPVYGYDDMSAAGVRAVTTPLALDCRTCERVSTGDEVLTFSNLWAGDADATVTIAQDGTPIFEGLTGEGVKAWSVERNGWYVLTHTTYANGVAGKVETAVFEVRGKEEMPVGELQIDWGQTGFVYDGLPKEPVIAVKHGVTMLTKGTHYLVEYKDNVNAGTAKVIAKGIDLYVGEVTNEFTIAKRSLALSTVAAIPDVVTNGKTAAEPLPTVTDPVLGPLVKGRDFELSYDSNTALGTATVRIIGIGNFAGEREVNFNIVGVSDSHWDAVLNDDGTVTIKKAGADSTGAVVIPSEIKGCAVTEIAPNAFAGRKDITTVSIPDSVKKIGNLAFANCVGLTTVVLPQGLELIDQGVFAGCSALRSVSIPESVTLIGIGAFSGCESLESLTLPSGLVTMDQGAFSSCSHLGSIVIPSNVATIGGYAFSDCVGLKTLTILAPYVSIGEFAFVGCTSLSLVTMPESVEDVGARAFWDCTALADASGFIVINTVLYGYCGQAKNLVIPDSISRVGNYALVWNEDIVSVVVPATVRAVGENAFYGCRELSSVTLMEGLTAIGAHAFEFCEKLTSLTVPSSVTSIGEHACYYLSGLKSLTVFGGLTSVGSEAFCFCGGFEPRSSVPNLRIVAQDGERIKQLLDDAGLDTSNAVIFAPCVITFNANGGTPESVRRVMAVGAEYGPMPFVTREKCIFDGWFTQIEGGEKIGSTSVAAGDATLYAHWVPMDGEFVGDVSGVRYSFHSSDGKVSVAGCGELASGELRLPTSYAGLPITGVADGAFFGRDDIVKIVLPDTFEAIGHHAFACCSNLISVTMGGAISSVGRYAFAGCPKTVDFDLPSGVSVAGLPKDGSLNQVTTVAAAAHPAWTEDVWDGCVDIDYTVAGVAISGVAAVTVKIMATDGVTTYPVTTVKGNVSASAGVHHLVWDAAADLGEARPQKMSVKVTLEPKDGSDEIIAPLVGEYAADLSLESFRTTFGGRTSHVATIDLAKAVPLRYEVASDGSAVITAGAYTEDGRILLPEVLDGHAISGIREGAFPSIGGGATFVLPDSTTAFDSATISKWTGLKGVTTTIVFPTGVSVFQVAAFRQFQNLTRVVFRGGPDALSDSLLAYLKTSGLEIAYPAEFAEAWEAALARYVTAGVVVLSAQPKAEDPTVMDVSYRIGGTVNPVKTRALCYKDNVRSFANVVRPETFVDGTETGLGDAMVPDVIHQFSWKVADDWQINLAKVRMEVLILPDDLLPLKFFTIPANGGHPAMTVSRNALTEQRVLDALLWLYADGDKDLTLVDGVLKYGDTVLASGAEPNGEQAVAYVFAKMGCRIMTEEELAYVNEVSRLGLKPEGVRQYAVKIEGE